MVCNKCGRDTPNDSDYCQYCGSKIEINQESGLNLNDRPTKEFVDALLKFQARTTIETMEANKISQPDNEGDDDFGLVPHKPVFTYAPDMVGGEKTYLDSLCTEAGEKIKYIRRGSMGVDGINGMIDIYDTFLPSGQKYKTIYINMYGAHQSKSAPNGFRKIFKPIEAISSSVSNETRSKSKYEKILSAVGTVSSLVLALISIISIIVSICIQDEWRDTIENWSPTVVYAILLIALTLYIGSVIVSIIKKGYVLSFILSITLLIIMLVTVVEGSVVATMYRLGSTYIMYSNYNEVEIANIITVFCIICIATVHSIPVIISTIRAVLLRWHKSLAYRERCYNRVEKMKSYLDMGIITKEEFEKNKQDIVKRIIN